MNTHRRADRQNRPKQASGGPRPWIGISIAAVIAVVVAVVVVLALVRSQSTATPVTSSTERPTTSQTPTQTALTPTEELLATTDDPNACVVSFAGDGITDPMQLQSEGVLFAGLPIPEREGAVFAGWYATPEDASTYNVAARTNGADIVACENAGLTLNAAWKTPEEVSAENVGVPILMYHQFTTRPEGEDGWLKANYAYIDDFNAQMAYLAESQFYLPTWDELSAFIDGKLYVPRLSAVVTDDDADQTWLDLAVPVVNEHGIMTTSFVITSARQAESPSPYVLQRSHTNDMHSAGDNGQGRIVNWTLDEIVADMETSAEILGAKEVMAYPYGHYNDTAKQALTQAGFEMARTVDPGYVRVGTDKLALPTMRMNYGMDLTDFRNIVG